MLRSTQGKTTPGFGGVPLNILLQAAVKPLFGLRLLQAALLICMALLAKTCPNGSSIDDRRGELVEFGCSDTGRFDAIECGGIDLGDDGQCLGLNGGGT